MLRQAQHERKNFNDFNATSVRPEPVEGRKKRFFSILLSPTGHCPLSRQFQGTTQVRVGNKLKAGKDTFIGPSEAASISGADIVFYVAGKKVLIGWNSLVRANFYAPNGRIHFKGSELVGSLIGNKLKTGKGSIVAADSFIGRHQ